MSNGLLIAISTVLAAVVAWLTTKWSTRKDYQYERSSLITTQRFEKEFHAVDEIVGALGKLVS